MEEANPPKTRRPAAKWAVILLLITGVIIVLVWYFVFRDTSPADVNSQAAKEAREEALSETEAPEVQNLEGVWIIDTDIGVFDDACLTEVCGSSFVGFRIDEELVGIGGKTVVGRTPDVSAQFTIKGTEIISALGEDRPTVIVDMTTLITDDAGRNNAIKRQAIETNKYPEASLIITESIDFSSEIDFEAGFTTTIVGELTIHGVTKEEAIDVTASFDGSRILVYGNLGPIQLSDYEIEKPKSAVVLSVEDNALMEFQLFFKKLS